ncbi:MAG: DUF1876 family protein [Promicromonosporaceae bacterium]|nr:DUF1876 family protein [Promicromonosporaceae bacterium]
MKATAGDRIMRVSGKVDGAVRDGVIVAVRGADGAPPYDVRWADGEETLVFPGGDCVVEPGGQGAAEAAATHPRSRSWQVRVTMVETGSSTTAEATLVGGDVGSLRAVGRASKDPADQELAVVGDEIAVGRALRRLADALLGQAEQDIAAFTGVRAHVHA